MNDFKRLIVETKIKCYGPNGPSPRVIVKFECGHVYRFHKNQYTIVGHRMHCPDCKFIAEQKRLTGTNG